MKTTTAVARRFTVSCEKRGGFAEMYRKARALREHGRIGVIVRDGRYIVGFTT